jgi:uncharacterized protein YjiK
MREIVYIEFESKSFSWANGLYVIIDEKEKEYHLCMLDDKGRPKRFDDNSLMISVTGKGNKGIVKTNLKYML